MANWESEIRNLECGIPQLRARREGPERAWPWATKRWPWPSVARATLIAVVVGLVWRTVRYALGFPLWGDEAFVAVNVLVRDFAGLARPPEFFQVVPPGFLGAEWLVVQLLGPGERALRLIPYLAGVAALLGFWRFCRKVASRRTVLVAVALLAASFYPVRHATEVKPYAIDLLIALAMVSLGWALWRDVRSYRRWLLLTAVTILGVWCSYPAVFPVAGVGLCLGARVVRAGSTRLVLVWLTSGLLMLVSWAVMFAGFAAPQARAAAFLPDLLTWSNAFPPLEEPWRLPWWLLDIHTGRMMAYPHGGHNFGSTLTTLLVVAGCVRMGRRRARRPLLMLLLSPLPPALIAAALHGYPYGTSTRTMLYMAPAFCLLAGEGTLAVLRLRHATRRGPLIVAGLLATLPMAGTAIDVAAPYRGYEDIEHRRLARWVTAQFAPGDRAVVFNSVTPPPRIPDLMMTLWMQRVGAVRYDLLSSARIPVHWEPDPESVVPEPGGKLWLIIQRHGDVRFFSEARLAAYRQALERRLGAPATTTRLTLLDGESWTICVYAPARRGDPSGAGPPQRRSSRWSRSEPIGTQGSQPGCHPAGRSDPGMGARSQVSQREKSHEEQRERQHQLDDMRRDTGHRHSDSSSSRARSRPCDRHRVEESDQGGHSEKHQDRQGAPGTDQSCEEAVADHEPEQETLGRSPPHIPDPDGRQGRGQTPPDDDSQQCRPRNCRAQLGRETVTGQVERQARGDRRGQQDCRGDRESQPV